MRYLFVVVILLTYFSRGIAQKIKIAEPVRFLALGDSYTIGQSVAASEGWPLQFASALAEQGSNVQETKVIAQTGWRTDNLADGINNQMPLTGYNLVSLLIGVNNQYQGGSIDTYAAEFEELLITAIALAGNSRDHVFVLSIPDYAYTPFGNGNSYISSQIDQFNSVNKQITEKYQVKYIDITPISRNGLTQPELIAQDGLHPSGIMYGLWVQEILKNIERELGLDGQPANDKSVGFTLSQRNLTLKTTEKEADLSIYSATGLLLHRSQISANHETSINLAGLSSGMYFVMLQNKRKVLFTRKIVIL